MLPSVVARNLGKQYRRYSTPKSFTLHEALLSGFRYRFKREKFWVLRGINITLMPGQMLGVVGKNGAGKSTLLKALSGVLRPDEGVVSINGNTNSLLRLGGSFHPELTGRENAVTEGVIAGLTRAEMKQHMDDIIDFASLSEFIDSPVRTYSSGMSARLGFAVAMHTEPKVLLADEHLAVGDLEFQQKCLKRIDELREKGCAVILVTHALERVKQHCDEALWLHHGQTVSQGDVKTVVGQYRKFAESASPSP
jgi:ABC-type polysaccharide/polyol phosphate transport system, ATPase component